MFITRDNVDDLVFYKTKYYHTDCFVELATGRAAKNMSSSPDWQMALNNLCELKRETKIRVAPRMEQDDLNDYLLCTYNLSVIPDKFWEIIKELNKGIYKKKSCKPIPAGLILKVWIWGQKNLDNIHKRNRAKNKGPKSNSERINYDLAIVLNHIEDYEKYVAKLEAEEAERKARAQSQPKINYNNIPQKKETTERRFDDISDLLDDIF
jgi:hypothetical protein